MPSRASLLLVGSVVLFQTACGGSDEPSGDGGTAAEGGGEFSIYVGEPENPLVPGNTTVLVTNEGVVLVDAEVRVASLGATDFRPRPLPTDLYDEFASLETPPA